jgi:hypothetical protein
MTPNETIRRMSGTHVTWWLGRKPMPLIGDLGRWADSL